MGAAARRPARRDRVRLRPGRAGRRCPDRLLTWKAAGVRGSVIDLANRRHHGYDLTDWLSSRPELHGGGLRWALGARGTHSCSRAAQGTRR